LLFGVSFHADKASTIGRAALERVKANPRQRLVGITSPGPRVPRQGTQLFRGAQEVGYVCSGAPSPTLGTNVASAYVKLGSDAPGTALELDFRGKRQPCVTQELPFFSRTRK
jgi:aminomethyltransferase